MPVFNTSAEPAPTPWPAALVNRKEIPMHSQGELNRHGRNRYGRIVQRRSAVAALADVFVQSLVIAGSCPDHAPKQRTSPIHNRISSIGYRAFGTSTTYSFNTQNPNRSNFGLRSHSVNPCVSRIHSQPISTYAAKSEIDDRGPRHSDYFPPMRVDNKISTSTERNPERMILGYDDLRTIRQSKETVEIPPHNASTHRYQDRRTIITSTNWRDRKRPAERPFTFKYHEKWVTNHKGRVKAKRRRNNKDGPAVKQRLQEPATASHLKLFLAALWDHTKSNQYIFSLYKRLPSPGVKILSVEERSELLYRFAHPPDRRRSNARYFLMLFKDMIDAGFKLSRSMCTSAIYFTSHKVPKLEKRDLMDAIAIWHRMETMYGIQSDNVVFELLFRIASLSGHFAVGDRLIQEMRNRGMRLSRRGHVSMLHSYGKRGDIEGLQKAFEEFVSLGEVVDTSVINCLISSLLNAGEFDKAQQIYSRMMRDHARTTETAMTERRNAAFYPSTSSDFAAWRSRAKGLSAAFETYLEMRKKQSRDNGQQLYVPIMPDSRTFYIMFRFHCVHTGDLTAVSQLLNDMEKVFESPPRTIVYYFLFRGFAAHSSAKGWTEARLLEVWKAFKGVLYDSYTRMDRFEGLRLPLKRATWENPLKSLQASQQESHAYSEALVDGQTRESQMDYGKIKDNTVGRDKKHGDEDLMALFDQLTQYGRLHNNWIPDENMLRRLDNGMFLSRELNIVILKAFGAHCDIKALLRLYSDIERMWKPVKRLAVDVQSMRKELRRQLVRIYKREQEMTKHRL